MWRAALAILVAVTAAGCQRSDQPADQTAPANVVLITIDTLRADRCSVYGYERPTTPFLQELAGRSTVFENAYSTSSWTAPSMASLFTSLPPRSHGVINGFVEDRKVINQEHLNDDFDTLAEVLGRHGYETFGVSTNGHLTEETGFAQGFDRLIELPWEPAVTVNEKTVLLRDRLKAAEQYFLWVHYLDPHWPYEQRQPWFDSYKSSTKQERLAEGVQRSKGDKLEAFFDLVLRYDSEINYVDESVRRLFEELDLEQDALVIVTSDHGEAFFDHGTMAHGLSLFEEEIRVPLIVRLPRQETPRRVASASSLVDIYPTILEFVGIEGPSHLAGRSLLPEARGEATVDRTIVTELDRGKSKHRALTWRGWKLYHRSEPDAFVKLFDLEHDAKEKRDLSSSEPKRLDDMQRMWAEWEKKWPRVTAPKSIAPLDETDRERLRALGYLE